MTVTRHDTRDITGPGHDIPTSAGPRLREARLEAKLSREEVATRLHLDIRLVEALESDDYASLPEATFVRGYLRGYARLLNLPAGPIVEAFDRHGFKPPDLVADIASKPQVHSNDISMRLVTYAVVGILVALAVAWWQTQKGSFGQPPFEALPYSDGLELAPDARVPGIVEGATVTLPPAVQASPATVDPGAEEAPLEAPVEADVPAETAAVPEVVPEAPSASALPGPAAAALQAPAPATVAAGGPGALVMRFKHDAWVEVYDKSRKRLFFGMAKAGKTVSVQGEPPLRVLIGYARDAQIEYNGASFDYAPYTSKDVARFSLE